MDSACSSSKSSHNCTVSLFVTSVNHRIQNSAESFEEYSLKKKQSYFAARCSVFYMWVCRAAKLYLFLPSTTHSRQNIHLSHSQPVQYLAECVSE